LAAFVRHGGNTVIILDLQSGNPRLVIDTGVGVVGLGMTESTIVVVGEGKIVAWNLVVGKVRVNVNDSVRITTLGTSPVSGLGQAITSISVSPGLSCIAISGFVEGSWSMGLGIYDVSTGRFLAFTRTTSLLRPYFTPDGCEIWGVCVADSSVKRWKIIKDTESDDEKLQPLPSLSLSRTTGVLPWRSFRGYEIAHDGWVLSLNQKRLSWLPHLWRSKEWHRTWSGQFLGLQHNQLPEIVILEFFE